MLRNFHRELLQYCFYANISRGKLAGYQRRDYLILVEPRGIEPLTSSLRTMRSTN